jgi:formylmethanofuran dehydrogenase subunit D
VIELKVSLVTGRTIDQGCGKEYGKLSEEYFNSVAICEMNPEDMKKLKLRDGDKVKVATKSGSVVVKARKSKRIRSPGMVFIPYGPWANLVLASNTGGTGMPLLKGVQVDVEPTDGEVLRLRDLLIQSLGKEKNHARC